MRLYIKYKSDTWENRERKAGRGICNRRTDDPLIHEKRFSLPTEHFLVVPAVQTSQAC